MKITIVSGLFFIVLLAMINKNFNNAKEQLNKAISERMETSFEAYMYSKGSFSDKNDKIEELVFGFDCYNKAFEISDARLYIINCAKEIVNTVNSYKNLSNEYTKFPIDFQNLRIGFLFYKNFSKETPSFPYIREARFSGKKISYIFKNTKPEEGFKERVIEESLEEALQKLKDEQTVK